MYNSFANLKFLFFLFGSAPRLYKLSIRINAKVKLEHLQVNRLESEKNKKKG